MGTLVLADGRTAPSSLTNVTAGGRNVALTPSGEEARVLSFEQIVESQPSVSAAVKKILRQVATLPVKGYKLDSQNQPEELDPKHPALRLVTRPAPRKGPINFKQWMVRPVLVHGNALMGKYRGDGAARPPTSLLPLRWQFVSAYASYGGPVEYWGTTQTGQWKWLPIEESLHFGWESGSGELGVSPLSELGVTVKLEDAAQRYQTASFENGVRPSGALVLPPDVSLKPNEREEFREEMEAMHAGPDRSFRLALLGGGADFKPMAFSAVEAQLIEQRRVNLQEVARSYDLPPALLGDTSDTTYNNVAEFHKMLYVTILRPWFTFFEETLQAQLIDPEPEWEAEGIFYRFDLGEVLRGDRAAEYAAAVEAFTNGLVTLNEARKAVGLPPIGDPDDTENAANQPHIPANNLQPLGPGPAPADRPPAQPGD